MSATRELPAWLVALLALVAIVVLGPPVLGFLLGVVGLAVGLVAVLLKVGLVVAAVYALVVLLRAVFGGSTRVSA